MTIYQNIIFITGVITIATCAITNYVLVKITGKKYDNLLRENNFSLPKTIVPISAIPDSWLRAMEYASNIVFPKNETKRKKYPAISYRQFDFRKHATKKDILLCKVYLALWWASLIIISTILISAIFQIK